MKITYIGREVYLLVCRGLHSWSSCWFMWKAWIDKVSSCSTDRNVPNCNWKHNIKREYSNHTNSWKVMQCLWHYISAVFFEWGESSKFDRDSKRNPYDMGFVGCWGTEGIHDNDSWTEEIRGTVLRKYWTVSFFIRKRNRIAIIELRRTIYLWTIHIIFFVLILIYKLVKC